MSVIGADPGQLRELSKQFSRSAGQIASSRAAIESRIRSIVWQGTDTERYRARWVELRHRLQRVEIGLQEASQLLRFHAAEQDRASAAGGVGTSTLIPASLLNGGSQVPTREEVLADLSDRDTQIQAQIRSDLEDLKKQRDLLMAEPDHGGILEGIGDFLPWVNSKDESISYEIARLNTQIGYLEGLLGPSKATGQPRQYLVFDSTPGDQRLVEVIGDLSEADRVVIHIPGMSTDLEEYAEGGIKDATNLYLEANALTDENVVVISSIDYNVPDDLFEAASGAGAESGVAPLQALVGDLHDMGFEDNQLSIVAHSYGTLVTGRTMQNDLDVGRAIILGSPGMGAGDRTGLGSSDVEVWAARAQDDPIGMTPDWALTHGKDPSDQDFGANTFNVPDARGHSAYFERDSFSLVAITTLAIGGDPVDFSTSRSGFDTARSGGGEFGGGGGGW